MGSQKYQCTMELHHFCNGCGAEIEHDSSVTPRTKGMWPKEACERGLSRVRRY